MKIQNSPNSHVEIEFHKLEAHQKVLFETLLRDNDVKFERNKTDGKYVAVVKMDKEDLPRSPSKSNNKNEKKSPSPRIKTRMDPLSTFPLKEEESLKRSFSPYKDTKHPVRPVKTRAELEIEESRRNLLKTHSSREVRVNEGKTMNLARSTALENFKGVFDGIDFDKSFFTPVHMSYMFLMQKVEFFYNKVFNRIQKFKVLESVNLQKSILDYYKKQYPDNVNYVHQSLANILYSVQKQSDKSEVQIFSNFLLDDSGSLKFLFYLYIRHLFKIITSNFFLATKVTQTDPTKIFISRTHIAEIVEQGFYFDEELRFKVESEVQNLMKGRKSIGYYEFMCYIYELDANIEVT